MKKSEAKAIGPLIVLGIILYPFIWLYENVGTSSLIIIGSISAIVIIFWKYYSSQKDKSDFNKLSLYVLHNRLSPNEARKIIKNISKSNNSRSALIRRLQILRDSIDISLTSKKRDTAESRMELVISSYNEILREHSHLITSSTLNEISDVISETETKFHTNLYKNMVEAHLEKADKLKTIKSKTKYANMAMDAILEGIENPKSDKSILEPIKSQVEKYINNLEVSS